MKRRAGILRVRPEHGNVGQEHRVITARDLDVVGLAARAVAELFERRTRSTSVGMTMRVQAAMIQNQRRVGRAGLGRQSRRIVFPAARRVAGVARIEPRVRRVRAGVADSPRRRPCGRLACAPSAGGSPAESARAAGLPCTDRRAATLEVATSVTPRSNSPRNRLPSSIASAMSVTNNSSKHSTRALLRDLFRDAIERIGLVLVLLQLVVHRLHEAMEVAALLVAERQALEEQVHQPGLAASDAAPDVQPALQLVQLAAGQQSLSSRRRSLLPSSRFGFAAAISRSRSSSNSATTRACAGSGL